MDNKWLLLGRALREGRTRAGLTQVGVADAIGVSRTPIQAIERGAGFDKVTGTMRSYARLVGWTNDSIDAVLAGGQPRYQDDPEGSSDRDSDLPLLILDELKEGRLLAADVLDLDRYGAGARMIVVVRGEADATPEEIKRDLVAWRRARRHLQDAGGTDADGTPGEADDQA